MLKLNQELSDGAMFRFDDNNELIVRPSKSEQYQAKELEWLLDQAYHKLIDISYYQYAYEYG